MSDVEAAAALPGPAVAGASSSIGTPVPGGSPMALPAPTAKAASAPAGVATAPPPGLAVVAACWLVQQLPALPPWGWALALLLGGLALAFLLVWRSGALVHWRVWVLWGAVAVAAGAWAMLRGADHLAERLPSALEGVDLQVVGVVEDLPQSGDRGLRFRFRIEQCRWAQGHCPADRSVRLSWYSGPRVWGGGAAPAGGPARASPTPPTDARAGLPEVRPGERWAFAVRLRRPHALLNPFLFDAEMRALQEGISALGYVRAVKGSEPSRRLDDFVPGPGALIERARFHIRDRLQLALQGRDPDAAGVLVALTVGDQAAIGPAWWAVFNRTGVGHLMSISGLHITMLAALGALLAGRLWKSPALARRMHPRPLPARCPTPYARWAFGVLLAFAYAALAGWEIPAQRTCWMLAVAGVALLSGRARSPVAVLSTAAAIVCIFDPWAPLAAGFWLSFAAVGSIIWYGSARGGRRASEPAAQTPAHAADEDAAEEPQPSAARCLWSRLQPGLHEALRTQWAATLVLIPLGVLFFSSVSLVSPLANAVAIPLVSGVITPLAMLGTVLALVWAPLGAVLLAPVAWLTAGLLAALAWLDAVSVSALPVAQPHPIALLLAALACALLLAPVRFGGRWLAGLGLCPLLLGGPTQLAPSELRVTALDVGQGTAVLVETAQGRLLYDTGPALDEAFNAGDRVILPWLRARGIDRLQALVVSHEDLDHVGGAMAVLEGLRVDWVGSSLAPEHPLRQAASEHRVCLRGGQWRWGEVQFDWLHPGVEPIRGARSASNARSCVLRVRSAAGTVLLAGDIESGQERQMLAVLGPEALRAQVLLAPHHGSRTSSSEAFLDAVAPTHALFQVGYRNRYRHPNAQVLQRYEARGIQVLRSDAHAAVELRLREGAPIEVLRQRVDQPRYWRVLLEDAPAAPAEAAAPAANAAAAQTANAAAGPPTAPSSPRRSSRPRRVPAARRLNTGTPPVRRSVRASRTPTTAASRRAVPRGPRRC